MERQRWFDGPFVGGPLTEKDKVMMVGKQSTCRRRCSCFWCRREHWEKETGAGLRAVAAAEYDTTDIEEYDTTDPPFWWDWDEPAWDDGGFLAYAEAMNFEQYQARAH